MQRDLKSTAELLSLGQTQVLMLAAQAAQHGRYRFPPEVLERLSGMLMFSERDVQTLGRMCGRQLNASFTGSTVAEFF